MTHTRTSPPFHGFRSPNFTSVPDELFDDLMADLSGAELKVLLYVIRRTFGFKKQSDSISLNQMVHGITTSNGTVLDHGTGLSKDSVTRAIKMLEVRHIIIRQRRHSPRRGDQATTYTLNVQPSVSENRTPPADKIGHPVPRKSDTQETGRQKYRLTNIDISTISHTGEGIATPGSHILPARPMKTARSSTKGFETIRDTLNRSLPVPSPTYDDRLIIRAYLKEFAQELGDRASLPASTGRALNLFRRAGCSRDTFISRLFEARAITKQSATTHAFPYFFAVLADLLGLKDQQSTIGPT